MTSREPTELGAIADRVIDAGPALVAAGGARRARWLADAFARLSDTASELGREACRTIAARSGLSLPMAAWALESALAPLTFDALCALEARPLAPRPGAVRAHPPRLCAVVLAGNIAIGAARAVGYPLLYGIPVIAKVSSDDDALARLLEAALAEGDLTLRDAYRVVHFDANDAARRTLLFSRADVVSVYGSDTTLTTLRTGLAATTAFLAHGHGLGLAYVGLRALTSRDRARAAARGLALDTAAYDQRGCLSPHAAYVERGGTVSPEDFAQLVSDELALLRESLPRGPLPLSVASTQLSWRGVGAMRGSLLEGDGHAVCFEADGPLRIGPGYRNLQILGCAGLAALRDQLVPLGVHLKCLGVAGIAPASVAAALPAQVAPRICALGEMQKPAVDALADGLAPWDGLVRWIEL
jgi:hypothetical protein